MSCFLRKFGRYSGTTSSDCNNHDDNHNNNKLMNDNNNYNDHFVIIIVRRAKAEGEPRYDKYFGVIDYLRRALNGFQT